MFDKDFYPTPPEVIEYIMRGESLAGKSILEPSAGKGNIVDYCAQNGADVVACEKHSELSKILMTKKCRVIGNDFFELRPEDVSHVNMIIMNPPFSADERHILHAWSIAPEGCRIIALCNSRTININTYRVSRELRSVVNNYGIVEDVGSVFARAERKTDVEISVVYLDKPAESENEYYSGFFMEEEIEDQNNGIMPYNFIRDVVNRYVEALRIYDRQLESAVQMNSLLDGFYNSNLSFTCTEEGKPKARNEFKKDLQKNAWNYIFSRLKMDQYTTKGLRSDINKFVEQQSNVPFTMKNIYRMIEIIIGTHEQRMDRAILDVFERLTMHYHDNRYCVEGWKTNSHYLLGQKFILPYMTSINYSGGMGITHRDAYTSLIEDLVKALCYITGNKYNEKDSLWNFFHKELPLKENQYRADKVRYEYNTWYDWGFFEIKGFKKGTMHFKFKDLQVWGRLNQRIAKLKGYPLFEHVRNAA